MRLRYLGWILLVLLTINIAVATTTTYTPSTETICNHGQCTKTLYSSTMYTNTTSGWKTLTQISDVTWEGDGWNFTYQNYSLHITPYVLYNGQSYTYQELKELFPNAEFKNHIQKETFNHKYALNITGIPTQYKDGIDAIGFYADSMQNLNGADFSINGYNVVIKNKVNYNFQDLVDSGYVLRRTSAYNLLITNITPHILADNSLYLDPILELQDADSENLDDSFAHSALPTTVLGALNSMEMLNTTTGSQRIGIIKWNTSSLPSNATIDNMTLYLYIFRNDLDTNTEGFNWTFYKVYEYPIYNISDAPWDETNFNYNNRPLAGMFNTTPLAVNITLGGTGAYFGNTSFPLQGIGDGFGETFTLLMRSEEVYGSPAVNDEVYASTKEVYATKERPRLDIYYHEVGEEPPEPGNDSCSCPDSLSINWEINLADYCVLSTPCDMGGYNITFNETGNFTVNSALNVSHINMSNPNTYIWLTAFAHIRVEY